MHPLRLTLDREVHAQEGATTETIMIAAILDVHVAVTDETSVLDQSTTRRSSVSDA
jgi:hypothetical protein